MRSLEVMITEAKLSLRSAPLISDEEGSYLKAGGVEDVQLRT